MLSYFLVSFIGLLTPTINDQTCTPDSKPESQVEIGAEFGFTVIYLDPDQIGDFKTIKKLHVAEDSSSNIQTFVVSK